MTSLLLFTALWAGQAPTPQPPQAKPDEVTPRGILPRGWKKLGLSDEQVRAIYKVQFKYRTQREKLEDEIARLKKQEREDSVKVLTDDQRKLLRSVEAPPER